MKNFFKGILLCSGFVSLLAHASIYDFSYTFDDNTAITGSLSGDLIGDYIENIGQVHVYLNGVKFSGSLHNAAWNINSQDWDNTIGALVSPKATLNNFIFADAPVPASYNLTNYFYVVNDPTGLGNQAFASNFNTGDAAYDYPANNSWTLIAHAPEPSSFILILLGGLFLVHRRFSRT